MYSSECVMFVVYASNITTRKESVAVAVTVAAGRKRDKRQLMVKIGPIRQQRRTRIVEVVDEPPPVHIVRYAHNTIATEHAYVYNRDGKGRRWAPVMTKGMYAVLSSIPSKPR